MRLTQDFYGNSRPKFRHLGRWYILALSAIAAISILGQILIQRHLADQFYDSQVVNLAGKQRMLSQRIAKVTLMLRSYQSSEEREKIADDLSETLHLWQVTQAGLQRGNDSLHLPGENSEAINEIFKSIETPFNEMQTGAKGIIEQLAFHQQVAMGYLQPHINRVLNNETAFLAGMDRIVQQYADEANHKVTTLSRLEYLLLIVSLLVIAAEVMYIFRPTAVHVARTVKKLRASEKNARKLLKEVGALYSSLERSYEQLSVINQPVENPRLYAKADAGGNVTFVSDVFHELNGGVGKSDRLCDLFKGMAHPDDWMDEIVDTVSEGNSWQGEVRFHTLSGAECWAMLIIQPVYTDEGEQELLMMGSNTTTRKQAELTMNKKNRAEIDKLVNQQKFRSVLILEGQEEERKRIAMDIHDGIGQMLTSLKYQIESMVPTDVKVKERIEEVDKLIKETIKEVRRVTFNLKPTVLGDYGLQAGLKVYIQEMGKLTDVALVYETHGQMERLPQKIENNAFRIIQEAVNNAIKYANASQITVALEKNDDECVITVTDNGQGFDTRLIEERSVNIESGRGFFNMYERTEYINGKIEIESHPGEGTRVLLRVPIQTAGGTKVAQRTEQVAG
ncbi:ATP-binding protein [Chryseolinea sp. T2]|uniref:sensor histidine kinase n=1 Tax=Chryseolinea sp. T2 TaxID=3129255 RepID=UPI00307835D5